MRLSNGRTIKDMQFKEKEHLIMATRLIRMRANCYTLFTVLMEKRELDANMCSCRCMLTDYLKLNFLLNVLRNVDMLISTQLSRYMIAAHNLA